MANATPTSSASPATPPTTPPTIAPVFDLLLEEGGFEPETDGEGVSDAATEVVVAATELVDWTVAVDSGLSPTSCAIVTLNMLLAVTS